MLLFLLCSFLRFVCCVVRAGFVCLSLFLRYYRCVCHCIYNSLSDQYVLFVFFSFVPPPDLMVLFFLLVSPPRHTCEIWPLRDHMDTPMPTSRAPPPTPNCPTTPIQTTHGPLCPSGLVCVIFVVSVCFVWSCVCGRVCCVCILTRVC